MPSHRSFVFFALFACCIVFPKITSDSESVIFTADIKTVQRVNLRRIREEQKINQEEAAERCGLHRTYYSGVERGASKELPH